MDKQNEPNEQNEQKQVEISEVITEFYRLKQTYESVYKEKYVAPIVKNVKRTNREKRIAYSKLPTPPCVNCGRNVGTIFSIKSTDELRRSFSVKCGDVKEPCSLDILFYYSERSLYADSIHYLMTEMDKVKAEIVKEKNEAMFFHNNEHNNNHMLARFEELSDSLKQSAETVGALIEQEILQTDNPKRNEELRKAIYNLNANYIAPFKEMIHRYDEYSAEADLNEAMRFYVEEAMPKIKEIREMKYAVNYVEYNDAKRTYDLIQRKCSLENQEYFYGDDDEVVKFVKGNNTKGGPK